MISDAVFRFPNKTDRRVVPWVTYTDPVLARLGVTEQQAQEQCIEFRERALRLRARS